MSNAFKRISVASIIMLAGFIFPLITMAEQKSDKAEKTFSNLPVKEFSVLVSEPGTVLLDVRTAEEFAEGHIQGAINVDVNSDDFVSQVKELKLRKNTKLAVYCRSGRRSAKACGILLGEGFKNVNNLSTGILGWIEAGKETVK